MMRQIRKQTLTMALGVLALLALGCISPTIAAGLPPQTVVDPLTGVAIGGADPVSYFVEGAPLSGKPDYEYDWQGIPWYFANGANRDVFMRSPETYAPQFGGHGALSMAQGYLSDGNPQIFAIVAQRLYLFYSVENRTAFLASPAAAIDNARRNWRKLTQPAVATPAPGPKPAAPPAITSP
jgi:YHS domain-containing protein